MAFQPIQPTALPVPLGALPAAPVTYVNGVQVTASEWDFTLLFSVATPRWAQQADGEPAPITAEVRVAQGVVMSPQQAKVLTTLLDRNVKRWEKQNGKIKIAPRVIEEIERQEAFHQEASAGPTGSSSERENPPTRDEQEQA